MKKYTFYSLLFLCMSIAACEDILEPKVDNTYGDEDTWRLPEKAEGVLLNAYANIDRQFDSYGNNFLDVATDNAVTNNYGSAFYTIGGGAISSPSNPLAIWGDAYTQFRNIHMFMEKGLGENIIYNLTSATTNQQHKNRLKGEAFFLRAWWGFKLLQHYGGKTNNGQALGYPIITRILTDQEATNPGLFKRNTYQECLDQISRDCDSAAYYLPTTYAGEDQIVGSAQIGRATKLAALALKSRAYTYGASPAYQPNDVTQITGMGSFTVVNNATYLANWEKAAKVSYEAITQLGNFSNLIAKNYNAAATPSEFLFRFYHNNRALETRNYPPSYLGSGFTGPSQNLVDAFPMKNGRPIGTPLSMYDPNSPYAGRDPRLDSTILRHGGSLGGVPLDMVLGGKDAQGAFPQATRTGYYLRKWLSDIPNMLDPESPQNDHHYHVLLRKTEVYLNFAEAANEAWGPTGTIPDGNISALSVLKSIRTAAGLNSDDYLGEVAGQGKSAFRALIQNERRIVLAFENHWFFDMRRWLLPLNNPVMGVKITRDTNGALQYNKYEVEKRGFNDVRYYYLPLPYDEVVKNQLVNNLGW
ncbi:RagB/SusD family nutrient uptake outer membrane protein [Rufibacter quisquiliarum]|uniref:Starch-binding associating with outer membrane n=1 Tax=Rufibacter quisquiliarum TaxID=1549639 RepID=A0A839GPA7_9BACT|nr:RagB/SusD family nutrient uptake outer membrane protein [Rufibacter quisquiliarum]MBA9078629.1 hypothetical protein [Rufibacter quisquiliarum]